MIPHESAYQINAGLLAGLGAGIVLWAALLGIALIRPAHVQESAIEARDYGDELPDMPSECAVYECGAWGDQR